MSITYGNYLFKGPIPIVEWKPPYKAGIYTLLIPDPRWDPIPYRPIYIGESGNLSRRDFIRAHRQYPDWIQLAGSEDNLYIAVYLMPNSTPGERGVIEYQLDAH